MRENNQFLLFIVVAMGLIGCSPTSEIEVELTVSTSVQLGFSQNSPGQIYVRAEVPESLPVEVMVGSLCDPTDAAVIYQLNVVVEGCANPGLIEAWVSPSSENGGDSYDCEVGNVMVANLLPPKSTAPYVSDEIFTDGDTLCNGEKFEVALSLE